MTALEFYEATKTMLENLANTLGITNLDRYYTLTDFSSFPQLNEMDETAQAYMQIAFHGQNATLISNIVAFEDNYDQLEAILCGFHPVAVIEKYYPQGRSRAAAEEALLEEFTSHGIKASLDNSSKRPNAILTGYVSMLLDAAIYLSAFTSKSQVIADLKAHYQDGNIQSLVTYFRSKIQSRFSIALTCDFLKEYSEEFDLPKPDIHIKDTLCQYLQKGDNYYRTEKREYECIKDMQKLTAQINESLLRTNQKPITVYQLDRMIWLICSNKFFLDGKSKTTKDYYLQKIG